MIEGIAEKINRFERKRSDLASLFQEYSDEICSEEDSFLEDSFRINTASHEKGKIKIVGVDGGLVKEELAGVDIALFRAVGTFFTFENGSLSSANYIPCRNPEPEPNVFEGLSRNDFRLASSLKRAKKEVELAVKSLNEDPDILMMDGSIVPFYRNRPAKDSEIYGTYEDALKSYKKLYKTAKRKKILLVGIVEDSRDSKICRILQERLKDVDEDREDFISRVRDSEILDRVLKFKERTSVKRYSSKENPVLKDLESEDEIFTFYMKTAKEDLPVKVDFLGLEDPSKDSENISKILNVSSSHSKNYGIPSPIIEADLRAKLNGDHLKAFKRDLRSSIPDKSLFRDLRRNRRPF